ncbi:MAG: phosphotriesterase-related protein [Chloroflexi bacterium]|nr:phosphotriesterase-related protein [Chloroflexota bacterium]
MVKTPKSGMSGLAQSVLGPVKPEALGPTMTHEHLLIDFSVMFEMPSEASQKFKAMQPITMENLGWIRYNWTSNKDNMEVLDETTAINEARRYMMAGGGTIVDATTIGIGRDPLALARISRATGVNVVMGAGFYIDKVHPKDMSERSDADLAAQMIKEITEGVGDTGVKAGVIGELGCSWPLTENERKVLRAAAKAQQATGAPILIHPGREEKAPFEIIEVLAEAGADIDRVIMGHLDRTIFDTNKLLDLAKTGCYLEYDLFGNESSHYPLPGSYMPSDVQRMDNIRLLIDKGHGDKVLTAQDICTKHRLVKYGGHGYHHIIENIVPRMRKRGFEDAEVDALLEKNPASILAFK